MGRDKARQSKFYHLSPYAYCAGDPVNLVDPDGRRPRIYVQKGGIGHAFLTVGEGENTIIYSYGRYGAIDNSSSIGSGLFTVRGEGVMLRYTGESAAKFLEGIMKEEFDLFEVNNNSDGMIAEYYDSKLDLQKRPTDSNKKSYNSPNAFVIDEYNLFDNNCVTTTIAGVNINQGLLDEDIWIPIKLSSNIKDEISSGNKNFRQIKDEVDFVKDLTNILYGKEIRNY